MAQGLSIAFILLLAVQPSIAGSDDATGRAFFNSRTLLKKKTNGKTPEFKPPSEVDQALIDLAGTPQNATKKADVKDLLAQGASPNACCTQEDGNAALHMASKYLGNTIVALALLNAGADIEIQNKYGHTPLHVAARYDGVKIAKLLLASGAVANSKDFDKLTPLHLAARWGSLPVAELLLKAGADVSARDKEGNTPLHHAAVGGAVQVASMLLSWGAKVDARDKRGQTPLHDSATFLIRTDVLKLLVENGADVNARDKRGETPLHDAASRGRVAAVEFLLEVGADKTAVDKDGQTPRDAICGLTCDGTEDQKLFELLT